MTDDLFTYVVSDDKLKLKLALHEATLELSGDQVLRLALFFANLRAEMSPPVPETSNTEKHCAACDRYEILQNPQDGTAQLYLRIPGLCWAFTEFTKEQCVRISETLNPQIVKAEDSNFH